MKQKGIIQVFSLPFYPSDVFLMLSKDYKADIINFYSNQELLQERNDDIHKKRKSSNRMKPGILLLDLIAEHLTTSVHIDAIQTAYENILNKSEGSEVRCAAMSCSDGPVRKKIKRDNLTSIVSDSPRTSMCQESSDRSTWQTLLQFDLKTFLLPRREGESKETSHYYFTHPQVCICLLH